VFFNRLGEIAGEYLRKGSKVYIEGSLRTRQWEKDGVKRYTTEIVANEMQMLDSRDGGASSSDGAPPMQDSASPKPQGSPEPAGAPGGFDDFDDDIPF